jgi:hypothetical protein
MLRKSLCSIALTLCVGMSMSVRAEIDGVDMYVYVEVSVREATIDGMRQRLALLQSDTYTAEVDDELDTQVRLRVADAYALFGTTASAHAQYGTNQAAAIEEWLNANVQWRNKLTALQSQFSSLSNQLSAARRT